MESLVSFSCINLIVQLGHRVQKTPKGTILNKPQQGIVQLSWCLQGSAQPEHRNLGSLDIGNII